LSRDTRDDERRMTAHQEATGEDETHRAHESNLGSKMTVAILPT